MNTKDKIKQKCKQIETLLLEKNKAYGDSALNPAGIFSKLKASEAIKIRLDDKLKRIQNVGVNDETEDTLMDCAGYMILLMIAKDNEGNNIQDSKAYKESDSCGHVNSTSTHQGGQVKVTYQED